MSDFRATDSTGADMSIEWTDDGGARIRVGGTQPLDQPACSIKLSREEMEALRDHLDDELGDGWQPIETAPKDRPFLSGCWRRGSWVVEIIQWSQFSSGFATVLQKYDRYDLSHWRPLPATPSTPAKGG